MGGEYRRENEVEDLRGAEWSLPEKALEGAETKALEEKCEELVRKVQQVTVFCGPGTKTDCCKTTIPKVHAKRV